jgi:hypothetical protein
MGLARLGRCPGRTLQRARLHCSAIEGGDRWEGPDGLEFDTEETVLLSKRERLAAACTVVVFRRR